MSKCIFILFRFFFSYVISRFWNIVTKPYYNTVTEITGTVRYPVSHCMPCLHAAPNLLIQYLVIGSQNGCEECSRLIFFVDIFANHFINFISYVSEKQKWYIFHLAVRIVS